MLGFWITQVRATEWSIVTLNCKADKKQYRFRSPKRTFVKLQLKLRKRWARYLYTT